MSSYFAQSRNVELSLLEYLQVNLTADWNKVSVVKTFAEVYTANMNLPIVCVRLSQTSSVRLETGSTTLEDRYLLIIDIFSRSDAQRLDLAYYIKDKLKEGWIHYNFSHASGNPEVLEALPNGRDFVTSFVNDTKVEVIGSSDQKDRYRHTLSVQVRKSS